MHVLNEFSPYFEEVNNSKFDRQSIANICGEKCADHLNLDKGDHFR